MTTYAQYIERLAGLNITGVKRQLSAPPTRINTADLPASYPRLPEGAEGGLTADGQGGWPALTAELVIVIEPVGQNLQPLNFGKAVAMLDALSAALHGASLAKSKHSWTIQQQIVNYGSETNYWTLVARVTGNG